MKYPAVLDPALVGTYDARAKAGGGYVWDAVLEYRVWCHPERGAPDHDDGNDDYYPFASYEEALEFSEQTQGAEEPRTAKTIPHFLSPNAPANRLDILRGLAKR